jgi:hypothetical protein
MTRITRHSADPHEPPAPDPRSWFSGQLVAEVFAVLDAHGYASPPGAVGREAQQRAVSLLGELARAYEGRAAVIARDPGAGPRRERGARPGCGAARRGRLGLPDLAAVAVPRLGQRGDGRRGLARARRALRDPRGRAHRARRGRRADLAGGAW